MVEERNATKAEALPEGGLARLGLSLANWSERWFPDALVFALLGIVIVFIVGLLIGEKPYKLALEGRQAVLGPHSVHYANGYDYYRRDMWWSSSPAVYWLIQRLAAVPSPLREGLIAFVVFFSMFTSLISWGFDLIFSGLLVRELVKRIDGVDY